MDVKIAKALFSIATPSQENAQETTRQDVGLERTSKLGHCETAPDLAVQQRDEVFSLLSFVAVSSEDLCVGRKQ
jgi:hypothetical protein